jgi:hypothetical protein
MYYTTPTSFTNIQYFIDTRRVSCLTSRTKCLVLGIFATYAYEFTICFEVLSLEVYSTSQTQVPVSNFGLWKPLCSSCPSQEWAKIGVIVMVNALCLENPGKGPIPVRTDTMHKSV